MPVEPNQNLLHYRLIEKVGEGGMGVVWRAQDTTLGREVAIKLLPAAVSSKGERLQRFEREARLLASLNHPNIATIHGFHSEANLHFLAMELVDGEDLSQRIAREPIPLEHAVEIALQVARALEAAHGQGVVHRDLKPANVKLTAGGQAKVLDFGLAKALAPEAASGEGPPRPSISPTLTSAGTVAGMILGTAAYMAPEQARGQPVDKRADLWAFGCLFYEMLAGQRCFAGETISDTLAAVLKEEPDFDKLPSNTPTGVRRLLRRCLQKNPHRRLHDIADARIEIEEIDLDAPPQPVSATTASRRIRTLPLLVAAGLGLVVGGLLWSFLNPAIDARSKSTRSPSQVHRSLIPLPEGIPLNQGDPVAISNDGWMVALTAGLDEQSRLYLRRLDSFEMEMIPGTEGAASPFFSPDDDYLGFFAEGVLKTVSLRGGTRDVRVLCDAPVSLSGTWDTSGWIYFTFGESRLARVREDGGDPQELGQVGDVHHVRALPDGRGILLTFRKIGQTSIRQDTSTIAVLSPDGTTITPVVEGGYNARYLSNGYLVFMRGGGLLAVPFDLERLEASPPAVSVQPNVGTDSVWATARFDISSDGTLVYVAGGDYAQTVPTWIDLETGKEEPLPVPHGVYNSFDLSPDGTQLAIQDASGSQDQIYVYESRRRSFSRLTLEGANIYPIWSHDGREVFFVSSRDGDGYRLYRKPADGSAPASRLLTNEQEAVMGTELRNPCSVTPDGKSLLVFTFGHRTRGGDLWKVPLDGSGDPEAVLATAANEIIPQVSPDGKWLAYLTDRSGPYRIMVRPLQDVERREWVISGDDGYDPRWSPRGDALIYRQGWGRIMQVPVETGDEFSPGLARQLLETDFHDSAGSSFAVSPDGKRILVNKPVGVSRRDETPISLVTGWAGEIARLAAAK